MGVETLAREGEGLAQLLYRSRGDWNPCRVKEIEKRREESLEREAGKET